MKWIGQQIYDKVSRFRDDVYLENIVTGTIVSGGHLGLDSNNKIVKAVDGGGDITGVKVSADTDDYTVTSGAFEFTIAGGTGITTSVSGTTLTVAETAEKKTLAAIDTLTGVTATNLGTFTGSTISDSSNIKGALQDLEEKTEVVAAAGTSGIVELATTAETNTGSDTARVVTPDGLNDWTGGAGAVTKLGTIATGVWNATAIASAKMATGTASAQGALELATTGEADTGTDTARAITAAGLKSHVDTRYSYSYITLSASAKPTKDGSDNPEWMVPNINKGIYEEDWNRDTGVTSTTVGATAYALGRYTAVNSFIIPHAGILVGFHGIGRNGTADRTFKGGLFHADNGLGGAGADGNAGEGIDYGSTGTHHEFSLRCIATAVETEASSGADGTSSHSFQGPCKLISNSANLQLQAGDALMPAIMGNDTGATDEIFMSMTIILKIPLA